MLKITVRPYNSKFQCMNYLMLALGKHGGTQIFHLITLWHCALYDGDNHDGTCLVLEFTMGPSNLVAILKLLTDFFYC